MCSWNVRKFIARMKSEPATILHFVRQAEFHGMSRMQYCCDVAEHVMNTVPESERRISSATGRGRTRLEFHVCLPSDDVDTLDRKRRENYRKVMRYLDGTVYMPVLMRRSFIACLPEPYRTECRRRLYRDEGFLAVPADNAGAGDDAGAVHEEYADVARSGGELRCDNGKIGPEDSLERLMAHRKELMDLIEATMAELRVTNQSIRLKVMNGVQERQ